MSIEFKCGECASTLRVPASAEGQQTRCPKCGLVQPIPVAVGNAHGESVDTASVESTDRADGDQDSIPGGVDDGESDEASVSGDWYVKTPDESKYGPATFAELQQWVKEGRIIAGCFLQESGSTTWQDATDYFPDLPALPVAGAKKSELPETTYMQNSTGANGGGVNREATARVSIPLAGLPRRSPADSAASLEPHRAGVILALGILGMLFSCPLFSFIAWAMGASDLKKMDHGQMDPRGREMTYTGYVLGRVFSIILLIGATIALLIYALSGN